jgi:hypothetical protein
MKLAEIKAVFVGRDGAVTKALYDRLMTHGPRGVVAVNLMRVLKNSGFAKGYRFRRSTQAAYDAKNWAIGEVCAALIRHPNVIRTWGWGRDDNAVNFEHVLYVDIPGVGQVSFHNGCRHDGPDYPDQWDGRRGTGPDRICAWIEAILANREVTTREGTTDGRAEDRTEGAADHRPAEAAVREAKHGSLDV